MKKPSLNSFVVLRIILDTILIPIILVASYILKFKVGWIFQKIFDIPIGTIYGHAQVEPYLQGVLVMITIWIGTFYMVGLYRVYTGIMPEIDELIQVIKGVSLAMLLMLALTFFYPFIPGSRTVMLYSWGIGILVLVGVRFILYVVERQFLKYGVGTSRTLVIGANDSGQDVVEKILQHPSFRLRYCGTLADTEPERLHFHLKGAFQYLGKTEGYQTIIRQHKIQSVFITEEKVPFQNEMILFCQKENINVHLLSHYANIMADIMKVTDFDGLPFMSHHPMKLPRLGQQLKRMFDLSSALLGLLLCFPLFCMIGLIIKIVSPKGPVFYKQERITKDEKPFNMIKFRTMVPDAEKEGPQLVDEKKETRYIPFGQFLRRYSLDELPQLLNVIVGEMSMVGPRPERPFFTEKYQKELPFFPLRHKVKAGITGWAQVNGRSVLTRRVDHKLKYDLYYIQNWAFLFDIKIILKSILVVLKGEEAY